ncbi:MAG TPA: NAD-glutamate dehydrogenase, partial [Xanthobacteraceae bacterium]|nr:NAD-glutamate dehydrogenase [Xanthobacteraceae bacterium]
MNIQESPRTDDGGTTHWLIGAATAALALREPAVPTQFVATLFGLAAPEDLQRYRPEDLAAMADHSWAFLAQRTPGSAKVRLAPDAAGRGVAVLEIVNDDMPFLLDSVAGELHERNLDISFLVHPVFSIERDEAGNLIGFESARKGEGERESFIHVHIDALVDAAARADVVSAIEEILSQVRVCVQDWHPMLARARETIADLRKNPPPLPADDVAEAVQFLEWLVGDNFTLLGARDYVYTNDEQALQPAFETGLGVLRSPDLRLLRRGNQLLTVTPEIREFLEQPRLLIVAKTGVRSRVHRRVYMDYVGIKRFSADGKLVGERRFCGLFTSTAYTRSTRAIPYLRRKVDHIIRRAGFDQYSHSGKALVNVLETYPRDELFQIDEDTLYQFALAILQLDERPRVRVLPRRDRFDRFVSVLVYVPRERYDSRIREAIGDYLATTYKGRVRAFYPFFPEGLLVRVYFIIERDDGETPNPDRHVLDLAVETIVRSWVDGFDEAMLAAHEPAQARALLTRYRDAFPVDYRGVYPPATAVGDVSVLESLTPERPLGVDLYRHGGAEPARVGLKVFSRSRPISLSERVPVLENMGFRVVDERTYHLRPQDAPEVWFHDMELESAFGQPIDLSTSEERLEQCFLAVMTGNAENDGYNALTLAAAMVWRDVALIRTISRFLR